MRAGDPLLRREAVALVERGLIHPRPADAVFGIPPGRRLRPERLSALPASPRSCRHRPTVHPGGGERPHQRPLWIETVSERGTSRPLGDAAIHDVGGGGPTGTARSSRRTGGIFGRVQPQRFEVTRGRIDEATAAFEVPIHRARPRRVQGPDEVANRRRQGHRIAGGAHHAGPAPVATGRTPSRPGAP